MQKRENLHVCPHAHAYGRTSPTAAGDDGGSGSHADTHARTKRYPEASARSFYVTKTRNHLHPHKHMRHCTARGTYATF